MAIIAFDIWVWSLRTTQLADHKLDNQRNSKEDYIRRCAEAMQLRYGQQIRIKITKAAHSSLYPRRAWLDSKIGEVCEPAGVELQSLPMRYVMPSGDTIPFSCAYVLEPHMLSRGNLHDHFRLDKPYFIRPESGGWQLGLGSFTITRTS